MLKKAALLLALSFAVLNAAGQYFYQYNERCIRAYEEVFALRFGNATRLINEEKRLNPGNNIPYLLDNYRIFLTLAIGENENDYKELKGQQDKIINRLKNGDNGSPYYKYALAQAYLQWSVVRIKFREYISAMQDVNRAYRLLDQNHNEFPDFKLNLVDLGVIHTLIGSIPDNFEWVKRIAGLEGTVNQGVNELFSVLDASLHEPEYAHLKAECLFYLGFIQLNLLADKSQALKYADYFSEYYDIKSNPLIVYSVARIYMNNGMNSKALEVLLSRPLGEDYYPFHYLDYLTGLARLHQLEQDALIFLLRFVINFKGINYIKAAYQKIAWHYLIHGDTANYQAYMQKTLQYGKSISDADKQAEREAKKGLIPNVVLLRARLLFDGGYYKQAEDELLSGKNEPFLENKEDSLELVYRLGRIYHEDGRTSQAIEYYLQTIEKGSQSPTFYAANAALKLGQIYEDAQYYDKAVIYYQAAQKMKNEEYKNSINQKAKAGINRIQKPSR